MACSQKVVEPHRAGIFFREDKKRGHFAML